jgi:hypothetical protein
LPRHALSLHLHSVAALEPNFLAIAAL